MRNSIRYYLTSIKRKSKVVLQTFLWMSSRLMVTVIQNKEFTLNDFSFEKVLIEVRRNLKHFTLK